MAWSATHRALDQAVDRGHIRNGNRIIVDDIIPERRYGMRDLLIITPSRGRPRQLEGMLHDALTNASLQTDVAVAYDNDDDVAKYEALRSAVDKGTTGQRVWWHTGPRNDLTGWTNHLALKYADRYRFLASLGDDHRPQVIGWDRKLTGAGAIAYGNDLHEGSNLPTAVVIRSDIVKALGWFCLPACRHYWIDNVWKDLGEGAGCLAYCENVVIEHLHPLAGTAPKDNTYVEALDNHFDSDRAAYEAWFRDRRLADIATVKTCLNSAE